MGAARSGGGAIVPPNIPNFYIILYTVSGLRYTYTVSQKGYHPTTNDNFNSSCLIPVMFGTNITE